MKQRPETKTPDLRDQRDTSEPDPTVIQTIGINRSVSGTGSPLSSGEAETIVRNWGTQPHALVKPGTYSASKSDREGYRLRHVMARGGQGEIWEALQVSLGRTVVVKKAQEHADSQVGFLKEACTAAQLDHPNIAPIYDLRFVEEGDTSVPLLAMKKVGGRCWRDLLVEERKAENFDFATFLNRHLTILLNVVNALAYAHSKSIIHRDIKPSQVMVGAFGEVFLLDWGLAIYLDDPAGPPQDEPSLDPTRLFTLESASHPAGTPGYMAPEQIEEAIDKLGFQTDVYLVGGTLYEILTGELPHDAVDANIAMERALRNDFDPLPPGLPPELADLTMHCMQTHPEDRPASIVEVRDRIEAWLSRSAHHEYSRELTLHVLATSFEEADYEQLSDYARQITEAEHAWPENPDLLAARDRVFEAFTDVALRRGDLIVAQVQSARVQDPGLAAHLRDRVDEARAKLARSLPVDPLVTPARLTALGLFGLLIVGLMAVIVTVANAALYREVEQRLMALAEAAARETPIRDLERVRLDGDIYAPEFQRIFNSLSRLRAANEEIHHAYFLRPSAGDEEGDWRVLVHTYPITIDLDGDGSIAEGERGFPPGAEFADIPGMKGALESGTPIVRRRGSAGRSLVGFAPINDWRTSEPYGLAAVEMRAHELAVKSAGVSAAGFFAGVALLVTGWGALLAFFHSRRLLERSRRLQQVIEKQNRELADSGIYFG